MSSNSAERSKPSSSTAGSSSQAQTPQATASSPAENPMTVKLSKNQKRIRALASLKLQVQELKERNEKLENENQTLRKQTLEGDVKKLTPARATKKRKWDHDVEKLELESASEYGTDLDCKDSPQRMRLEMDEAGDVFYEANDGAGEQKHVCIIC